MHWSRPRTLGTVVALAASALAIAPAAAVAQPAAAYAKAPRVLATGVLAPFQIAVNDGRTYVADGFIGMVSLVNRDGSLTTLAEGLPDFGQGREVAGLDVVNDGNLWAYTTTQYGTAAQVVVKQKGRPDVVADTLAYETAKNPDGKKTYGLNAGAGCAEGRAWLEQASGLPATYTGIVDSHPYSVAYLGKGGWAVADAGANAILEVSPTGKVSTIAVLIQEGGRRTTFATVESPLATEVTGDAVYVATMAAFGSTGQVLAPGSILKYGR